MYAYMYNYEKLFFKTPYQKLAFAFTNSFVTMELLIALWKRAPHIYIYTCCMFSIYSIYSTYTMYRKGKFVYLTMPPEHIDFHITGYWTSSIWSL